MKIFKATALLIALILLSGCLKEEKKLKIEKNHTKDINMSNPFNLSKKELISDENNRKLIEQKIKEQKIKEQKIKEQIKKYKEKRAAELNKKLVLKKRKQTNYLSDKYILRNNQETVGLINNISIGLEDIFPSKDGDKSIIVLRSTKPSSLANIIKKQTVNKTTELNKPKITKQYIIYETKTKPEKIKTVNIEILLNGKKIHIQINNKIIEEKLPKIKTKIRRGENSASKK